MEQVPDPARVVSDGTRPADRQLPSGRNKVERIAQHSTGLVEDVKAWVDLKIKLTKIDVEQRIQEKVSQVILQAIGPAVMGLAGLFALVTLAIGLGWWLGHYFWGFLIVTVLLGSIGFFFWRKHNAGGKDPAPAARIPEGRPTARLSE